MPLIIKGSTVHISTAANGNGHATWELPDGSNAYVRTRGLDEAAIASVTHTGTLTRFACTTTNGDIYRVDALSGDALMVYLGVIDRSPPHDLVGRFQHHFRGWNEWDATHSMEHR